MTETYVNMEASAAANDLGDIQIKQVKTKTDHKKLIILSGIAICLFVLIGIIVIIVVLIKEKKGNPPSVTYTDNEGKYSWYICDNGYPLCGYDPISYFNLNLTDNGIIGNSTYNITYKGALFIFTNEINKNIFNINPKKYIPKYGGYCAYAVSQGSSATSNPNAWSIINNVLYMNYDFDIRTKWRKDTSKYIQDANEYWNKWGFAN